MPILRVTVCEMGNDDKSIAENWGGLVTHAKKESSEFVLLPELPFFPWPASKEQFNLDSWGRSVLAHDQWVARFGELRGAMLAGTRPVARNGKRINEGFVWTEDGGYQGVHGKHLLPDEEGSWEATWYDRGDDVFEPVAVRGMKLGFLICSELWAMWHATGYSKSGAHVIATPRATGKGSLQKWLAGGRVSAVVSGCFSISSNRVSTQGDSGGFGGMGWIIGQDGDVLATTSVSNPFVTRDIDLDAAVRAKGTYPRYCLD